MSSPPPGVLSYGWMPGPEPAVQRRDDEALAQWLRDLDHSAADDPDTQLPLDDADAPPGMALPPEAVATSHATASTARLSGEQGVVPASDTLLRWSADAQATRRLTVSIALVLGLFGVGLAFDYFHVGRHGHGAAQQAFEANVSRTQDAVTRPEPTPARADDTVQIVGAIAPQPAAAAPSGACDAALVALALCQPTNTARSTHAP